MRCIRRKKLLDAGLRVCISTDNMTLAAVTLEDEYRHCIADMGFTPDDLQTMAHFALDAAFLPEQEKRALAGKNLISNKYSIIS